MWYSRLPFCILKMLEVGARGGAAAAGVASGPAGGAAAAALQCMKILISSLELQMISLAFL